MKKRILAWLLLVCMIVGLLPTVAFAADTPPVQTAGDGVVLPTSYDREYNVANSGKVTISTGGTYKLTGTTTTTTTTVSVTATDPVTLVLAGVKITGAATSPLDLAAGAQVTLVVLDGMDNVLNCTAKEINGTNQGKTAGIHVPETASLTIDKKAGEAGTGTLSVKGGYGSAGIGGNAGYGYKKTPYNTDQYGLGSNPKTRYTQNLYNDVGNNGISYYSYGSNVPRESSSETSMDAAGFGKNGGLTIHGMQWGEGYREAYEYEQAGFGGAPGLDGKDAEKSGAVTINAGSINVVAASAAGIGGGKGYDGQAGVIGYTGSGYNSGHDSNKPFNRVENTAANGSGGGGAGGYGGRGGDSGAVTINGGALSITVSAPTAASGNTNPSDTQHVKTTQDKIMTAGIGGGPGGWGGAGGAGGPSVSAMGYSPSQNPMRSYYGGAGGAGQTGYTGYGGTSEKITITGGVINVQGAGVALGNTVNKSDVRMQASVKSDVLDYNLGAGKGHMGAGGGNGGKRTQPAAIKTESEIEVSGGNVTVKNAYGSWGNSAVTAENDSSVFSNAPVATDGGGLHTVILNVKDATTQAIITDAKIAIPVTSENGHSYTYYAETDKSGRAVLWLPPATYTLSGKMVSNSKGVITDPVEVTTAGDTAVETTVYLGDSIALSLSSMDKTYFSGEEKPINLLADTSLMKDVTVTTVKWFAESYTSNKEYATVASSDGTLAYDVGYAGAEALKNAGTIADNTDGVYSLPINENGHYWVQVEYLKNGQPDKLVSSILVSNLYRKIPITVKTYLLNTDTGIKESETRYEALKNADGSENPNNYGFAFDLNGYKADNTTNSVLLDSQVAGYDEVDLVPKSTMATWYDAKLKADNTPFPAAATGGYTPIKLTLNKDFLDTAMNTRCDTVEQKKDVFKYTIVYTARDGALDVVTITGTADGVAKPFYTHERSYTSAIDKDTINAIAWPGYKLIGVKVNGTNHDLDKGENDITLDQVTIDNIHGKNSGKKIKTVEFLYENNMTDVTVNAVLNDAKKDTDTPNKVSASYTVPVEIGTEKTFTPPVLDGYRCVGSSKGEEYKIPSVAKGDSITFYYEKVDGNVTYQAVCEEKDGTKTVLWTDKGTVTNGQTPADKTPDKGVDNYQEDKDAGTKYTITGTDTPYPNTDGKYDGVNDITVTYTYKHKTRKVQVQWMNVLNTKVVQTDAPVDANVGEYANIHSTVPADYTVVGSSIATIFVDNTDTTQLTATLYCKPSEKATITIQMFSKEEAEKQDGTPFNTVTLIASYDAEQTVNAPTLLGWELKTGEDGQKKITPIKGQTNTVKFVYEPVYDAITVQVTGVADADLPAEWKDGSKSFPVQKGQDFTVQAPSFAKYKLAKDQPMEQTLSAEKIKGGTTTVSFAYVRAAADMVTITVNGETADNAPLYTYDTSVPVETGAAVLNIYDWPQYKVQDAQVAVTGGTAATATVTQGKASVNFAADAKKLTVTATYVKNTANVTVKAHLFVDGLKTDEPVDGFNAITFEAVIGDETSYTAPSLPGYALKGDSMTGGKITVKADAVQNVIIFYYAKNEGLVTYKAVDGEGHDLGYSVSEALMADTVVTADDTKAPTVPNYRVKPGSGVITGATADSKFDGKNPVTVTYTYTKFTKQIKIILMDDAKHTPLKEVLSAAYEAGASVAIPAPDITTIPEMSGYKLVSAPTQNRFIMDNNNEQSVTFYYSMEEANRPQITVNLKDEKGTLIHSYTVTGDWGVDTIITIPDLTEQGYEYSEPNVSSKVVTPVQGTPDSQKLDLTYKMLTWKVTVTITPEAASNLVAESDYARTYTVRRNSSFAVTAPSIAGYTLTSGNLNVSYLKLDGDKQVTFVYQLDGEVTNSIHTIVGVTDQNVQLYKFTQTVAKGDATTTYTATPIDGYSVDKQTQKVSNATNQTVTFTYTNKAATVTVVPVDESGDPIPNASVTYTGYEKGQKGVKVRAIHVDGKTLVGDLIQTVNLSDTAVDNEVKFTYKDRVNKWTFILNCADDNVIIRVIEATAGDYSVAAGGQLDLTAEGFDFDASNPGNSATFLNNVNGSVSITEDTESNTWNLYYKHHKQAIEYKYVSNGEDIALGSATNDNPTEWNVNENLVVAAPQIPGYTAVEMRRSVTITKQANGAAQVITFQYIKKATGTITVEHKVDGEAAFSSYEVTVSDGEWFTANALNDPKYTLVDQSKATQTIQANSAAKQTITFVYEKNFVLVNTFTNVGGTDVEYEKNIEVIKGKDVELTPPARNGFVLKGITVTKGGADMQGSQDNLQIAGYANDKLTLTALDADAVVKYYYKPISDAVDENQVEITVIEKYEVFELGRKTYKETKLTTDGTKEYAFTAYDGFKVTGYQIDSGAVQQLTESLTGASVDHKENHTITYIYGLADGSNSVVVPGKDGKLPSVDDVTIKPAGGDKPGVDDKGTVTVPNGGGTVETPNGKVDVPGGTTVDKDGTIKTPTGEVIDPSKPGEIHGNYFIHYKPNGGVGESYTQYIATGTNATLKNVGELFSLRNFTEDGWNTHSNGKGVPYADGAEYTEGKSLTLYAQWKQSDTPTGNYSATIVLKPNGAESADVTQTIVSDDNDPIRDNVQANPFKIKDWTFAYWLNESGGIVPDKAIVEVADKKTLTLTAQWFKENADGSITVPGQDGKPGGGDDVTAKPSEDKPLDRNPDTGVITVPNGGSVIDKDGTEIAMPNGGTLKPDGTITITQPGSTDIVVKPDGSTEPPEPGKTVYTLTYKSGVNDVKDVKVYYTDSVTVSADVMTREGYKLGQWLNGDEPVAFNSVLIGDKGITELTAKWYKVNADNSITVPGKDGEVEAPKDKDNVTVKPGKDGTTPDVDKDGKVTVPDNGNGTGTVVTPDGELVVPGGSKVDPDGTITGSDGKKLYPTEQGEGGQDKTPDGYFKVTYKPGGSDVEGQKDVIQLVKQGSNPTVMGNPFKTNDKTFIGWDTADVGDEITSDLVLTAQWKATGSVVLAWDANSKVEKVANEGVFKLIMRGEWATTDNDKTDKAYVIPVLVDGKEAVDGELRWYVDADSYKNDFGFRGDRTGSDIVAVNAQTGEITAKNSGVVRVWCESTVDPTIKLSVVVIVAGDVNRDGYVDLDDASWLLDVADALLADPNSFPATAWYLKDLADLSGSDGEIDYDDVSALLNLAEELVKI